MAQYTLPDWARLMGRQVDLRTSPYWGMQDRGDGVETMGNGDGSGYYAPLERFAGNQGRGENMEGATGANVQGAIDWLGSPGQQVYEANDNGQTARWLQDATGNITAEPVIGSNRDRSFGIAALLAGGLAGGAAAGLYGGAGAGTAAGAGAAEAGIGTLGTIAPGSSALAPIATTGTLSTAPAITASIPQISGGLLAAGASPAMNAALAESAAGTAGYGASSAGAGGGAGELAGGMFSGLDMQKIGGGLLEYAAKNPKVVGGLLGGLAGATGGLSSGSSEAPYTGPMPTISRGGWQPRAQAQQMALPTFGQGLSTAQGNAGSGLWRFMGGK